MRDSVSRATFCVSPESEEMEGTDGTEELYSSHSESDGHPGEMLVEEGDLSDTDSEDDDGDILEDGCNSAGEEVSGVQLEV